MVVGFAAVILAHECMHSQLVFNIISCAHTFSVPHCVSSSSAVVETVLADADSAHIQDWSKETGACSNKHMVLQETVCFLK